MFTESAMTSAANAESYVNSRRKDYLNLSHEISDSKGDLGYCKFLSPQVLQIKDSVLTFPSNIAAKAHILRIFW